VINTLASEKLYLRAEPIRDIILTSFKHHLKRVERVTDIRGLGLMIGIEVQAETSDLVATALAKGAVVNVTAGNTIRLLPPLVMSDEEAADLGRIIATVVDQLPEHTP